MPLNKEAITSALNASAGNIKGAQKVLRERGFRFRDSKLSALIRDFQVSELDPDPIKPETLMPHIREPVVGGVIEAPDKRRAKAQGKTFVFTCAQNNTLLHERFWKALQYYVDDRKAELHVSRFVYNKAGASAADGKADTENKSDKDSLWYDPRIEQFASDESLQITPDLVWCGELNIIPTAKTPLSTLSTYTRQCSGIIPHTKMHMQSVPTMKFEPVRLMYTTGTCTQRNYIQRVAGQVAEFHHVFGALVVEVDNAGNWWARQLNADKFGGFYDLDTYYTPDGIDEDSHRIEAITHGDLHGLKIDSSIFDAVFKEGGIVDMLLPREQFFHDTIDFMPRNHHNIKDPHFLHKMWVDGTESVAAEFDAAAGLLQMADRPWCKSYIVESNHDVAFHQWLRDTSAFYDPPNMEFWLKHNLISAYDVRAGRQSKPFKEAITRAIKSLELNVGFIGEDDSYKILGVIEAGLHGHLGPNGSRGSPKNLRTVGKANTAHTHSAGIIDGIYTAGVYGKLDMGYNKGLSSWSHSCIITYPNAKRSILTIRNGKAWRDIPGDRL